MHFADRSFYLKNSVGKLAGQPVDGCHFVITYNDQGVTEAKLFGVPNALLALPFAPGDRGTSASMSLTAMAA